MSEKTDVKDNPSDSICSELPENNHSGSGTIVIMDDEEYIRDSLSDMLMCMGYDVIHMEDGKEVIIYLKEKHYGDEKISAIILDLVIPGGMGGKDTAAEIQKIVPDIPVFVISGYSDDPVMNNPREYGFKDGLSKPFLIKDLADMLGRYL